MDKKSCRLLFVCTGNTCRSPLAAALARRILGEKFTVSSAGLAAGEGGGASQYALQVGRELGVDLSAHAAVKVSLELLEAADWIIPMTREQERELCRRYPGMARKVKRLGAWGSLDEDVRDPWGGSLDSYRETARQLERLLRGLKKYLLENGC